MKAAGTTHGRVELRPGGRFVAGSEESFDLVYTAGSLGMDDLGGLKVAFRFACDQSPLQVHDPAGPGHVSAVASNGSLVKVQVDPRGNARPWYKALKVTLTGGGLLPGDSITVHFSRLRLQTFVEKRFTFRVLVDVFSTNVFTPLPSPCIEITSGPPDSWHVVVPSLVKPGEVFRLSIRADDRWGNPSDKVEARVYMSSTVPVEGLPPFVDFEPGMHAVVVESLRVACASSEREVAWISISGAGGVELARSNPLVIDGTPGGQHRYCWGDLHGQSGETIGTGTIEEYFDHARNKAFLDVAAHQGNDFQVSDVLWARVNDLAGVRDEPGRFVVVPGYEWSGNTAVGGDRNVYFLEEGHPIHRSSHALLPEDHGRTLFNAGDEQPGIGIHESDKVTAGALFRALEVNHEGVIVVPHAGGRPADIRTFHDGRMEHSVEIQSCWGVFEWLLHDAFEMGYRVGIVANSDDHKGRPGSAHPGASKFGMPGGLTCFIIPRLDRRHVFEALKRRHHYATTGARIFIDAKIYLDHEGKVFHRDPAWYTDADHEASRMLMIGDIAEAPDEAFRLEATCIGTAPLERIEIFDGIDLIETIVPGSGAWTGINAGQGNPGTLAARKRGAGPGQAGSVPGGSRSEASVGDKDAPEKLDPGRLHPIQHTSRVHSRVRIAWEGAEYRGRQRNTTWTGSARISGNCIVRARPINFWNPDSPLEVDLAAGVVSWSTITAGNFQAIELALESPFAGMLEVETNQVSFSIPLHEIGLAGGDGEHVYPCGGLGKKMRVFRLPPENTLPGKNPGDRCIVHLSRVLRVHRSGESRIFLKVTQEDGHQAWTSPMYLIRPGGSSTCRERTLAPPPSGEK